MSDKQNNRIYTIVVVLLMLLSAVMGFFFWQRSRAAKAEAELRQQQITELNEQKERIGRDLDSLSLAYADLRIENEFLQGKVSSTAEIVNQKELVIKQIKSQNAKDVNSLRQQVTDLQKAKTEFETIVNVLREENAQLRAENERLTGENAELKTQNTQLTEQVSDLAKQLEEQIRKTQSASFRATSFRVEVQKRNEKLTSKARRSKGILVTFDLADVPSIYQGPQKLYLVVTDERGNPIPSANPIKATVYAPTGPVEIIAQEVKQVNLENTQRLSFTHKFDDRLNKGNYVVAIYCDKGLLGASSFKVI